MNTMVPVFTGCGFKSSAGLLKVTNCLPGETLTQSPVRVTVLIIRQAR